jgi:hypothetical protein
LPKFSAWQRQRRRAAANGPESKSGIDKLGDAVDNIFKFERKRRR